MSAPPPRRAAGPRVIVIGAGAIGLFCALELARRGAQVTVVEADAAAPHGARPRASSLAAAGMLGPFSEALHESAGRHRRLGDLYYEGLCAWREAAATDTALSRFVRFSGALLLAFDEADEAGLLKACDKAEISGEACEFRPGPSARVDGRLFAAGVRASAWLPSEGVVDAAPMLAALAARLILAGGSILRSRAVVGVETSAGRAVGIEMDDGGALAADAIVAAPGALGAASLAPVFPVLGRVIPTKGILGATRMPAAMMTPDVVRAPGCYVVRAGDEILFGASMQPNRSDLDEDDAVLQGLHAALIRLLPGAALEEAPRYAGIGVRPVSPDGAPIIGAAGPEGCFVACGHGRNGWLLAPATGRHVADLVLGAPIRPFWSTLSGDRFG